MLGGLCLVSAALASAQTDPNDAEPRDQIVLSGDVQVRRGQEVGEVVVLRGTATVAGVVRGDVVVLDGRIDVTGQVSGAVVSVGGSVALGPSSRVLGDVLAHDRVIAAPGRPRGRRRPPGRDLHVPNADRGARGVRAVARGVVLGAGARAAAPAPRAEGGRRGGGRRRTGRRGSRSGGGSSRSSRSRWPG